MFRRVSGAWSQLAYGKASNTGAGDAFGIDVDVSADGLVFAVGAIRESSSDTGVGGDGLDDAARESGAVYIFSVGSMSQQAYLKASNTGAGDWFGLSVALDGTGSTLLVGAVNEASAALGVNSPGTDDSMMAAGAAYLFTRSGTVWAQQAYIKHPSRGRALDNLGADVAITADAASLFVACPGEDSAARGIGGDELDDTTAQSGAVFELR